MRYGVKVAIVMGVLLPTLETYRRGLGEWGVNFTTMFEDYLGGAFLLGAAWAVHRRHRAAPLLLLAVWSAVTAMILISTIGQIEATVRGSSSEARTALVAVVKFVLLILSASALLSAYRAAAAEMLPPAPGHSEIH